MALHPRNSLLLITILCFLHASSSAVHSEDPTYFQLSESLQSKGECDENALFPEPPCCGISNRLSGRIHGGKITDLNEFPWMVLLCVYSCHGFGGGGLINSRWVLTAAHNVAERTEKDIEVHLGEWNKTADHNCADKNCNPKHKILYTDKMIVHELYTIVNYRPEHDVAVLHLTESVTFTGNIQPICLPLNALEQDSFVNQMALAIGWGFTETEFGSDVLLKASVKVWDSISCQQHTRNPSLEICAGGAKGIGSCSGDSGGPLMMQLEKGNQKFYLQIGLVSYTDGCGKLGTPTIYASIPAYMQWIKNTILNFQ